jgi:hypothetical protein
VPNVARYAQGKGLSTAVTVADLLSLSWDAYGEAGAAGVWLPGGFEVTYAGPDGREVRAGLERLRRADLEACEPVRSFPSYKGQRNYPGFPRVQAGVADCCNSGVFGVSALHSPVVLVM